MASTVGFPQMRPEVLTQGSVNDVTMLSSPTVHVDELIAVDGWIEVPGVLSTTEGRFTVTFHENRVRYEGHPEGDWPKVVIDCETDSTGTKLRPVDFSFKLVADTVDAWLLHTRISFALNKSRSFLLVTKAFGRELEVPADLPEEFSDNQLAKVIRKLKFIESVFNVKFSVPDVISPDELQSMEVVFRGITEAEFSLRAPDFTFRGVPRSGIDLRKPPFNGPGSFTRSIGDTLTLLGRELPVGPVTVSLEWAELKSPGLVKELRSGSHQFLDVPLEALDNQILYRFERYGREPIGHLQEKLSRFKMELRKEEPDDLVCLVGDTLQKDVSAEEALQIAVGWQLYNNLPDRFCPQQPLLDEALGFWRVPIYLVYTGGEGGPVGELAIDRKSGKIIRHTPFEELKTSGLVLADRILHGA